MKWWRSLSVIIINIHDRPWMSPQHILSVTPPLVTFSFWWLRLLSVTIAHMKWWRSLSVIIINIRDGPWMSPQHIISVTPPLVTFIFLVMETIVYHHCPYEMVMVTICHHKSLLMTDLECHHNTYTFGDAAVGDVQFLVRKDLLTITNELMVTFFSPHQCYFFL